MKFYLGVTDPNWFNYLSQLEPPAEDINFWQPGGKTPFKVLEEGAPFLFKLRKPHNHIAGVGFFSKHSFLPLSLAWEIFGEQNGCDSLSTFQRMIRGNRRDQIPDPTIGCIVLNQPIFFRPEDWIDAGNFWSKSIVQGKSFDTTQADHAHIWEQVQLRLEAYPPPTEIDAPIDHLTSAYTFGKTKLRKGQAAFRVDVLDAYGRRCAMTGEKTLPVLEAAHIRDYAAAGPNITANGLLLRSDLHKLFDRGYLTVTKDYRVEVSGRIREEFDNGKEYYKLHGSQLAYLPGNLGNQPSREYIQWHNENRYNG